MNPLDFGEPPKITVYTTARNSSCAHTIAAFDRAGVAYTEIDVTDADATTRQLRALGYTGKPVVQVDLPGGTEYWDGYRPDRIRMVAALATRSSA